MVETAPRPRRIRPILAVSLLVAIVALIMFGNVRLMRTIPTAITQGALRLILDGLIVVDTPPDHVSVVAVHGGGGVDGLREWPAAELILTGRADHIVAMGGPLPLGDPDGTYANSVARRLTELGVDRQRIVLLNQGGSPLTELRAMRDLAVARGWTSLALSTSRWHTRRVSLSAQVAFRGTNLKWWVISAPVMESGMSNWWETGSGQRTVIGEWMKTGVLLAAGRD